MNEVFGASYSGVYDWLYGDKDYLAECQTIRRVFDQYALHPIETILDLGCGSGNHALPLAAQGFAVTGVDRSEDMLAHARSKAGSRATFLNADIRSCDLGRKFDAALMMFAVLGYQVENSDVLAALQTARRHLVPAGLLLFDCWYGPAVLTELPSNRIKTVDMPEGRMTRSTSSTLDVRAHTCRVDFQVEIGLSTFEERHTVRYFFPKELELYLELAGFDLMRFGRFPDVESDPALSSWNILAVARAKL